MKFDLSRIPKEVKGNKRVCTGFFCGGWGGGHAFTHPLGDILGCYIMLAPNIQIVKLSS